MSETIEFDARALLSHDGTHVLNVISLDNIVMRPSVLDVFSDTMVGQNLRVALTLVDPEPPAFAPPWDDAPDWAEWAARNKSYVERWYETRPSPGSRRSPWWTLWDGRSDLIRNWHEGYEDPNWRTTLQERPKPPEPELDPCPHCGGEWGISTVNSFFVMSFSAVCVECRFRTPSYPTRAELAQAVNRRPA